MTSALTLIKARLEAATPGKWFTHGQDVLNTPKTIYDSIIISKGSSLADAKLIAHAPTDIANLIRALECAMQSLSDNADGEEYWECEREIEALLRGEGK